MDDTISRRSVIKEIDELLHTAKGESEHDLKMLRRVIKDMLPSAQPEITYQTCSDALLKMWMDNVLTDGEYNRIMDKLNAWKGAQT